MSDVIVVMRDGRIQQQGHPEDLYERPVNRFVAGFVGTSNFLAAKVVGIDAATGTATAETDSGLRMIGRVTDPDARLAAGDEVTVAIRPEAPVVEALDAAAPIAAGDGMTRVTGQIKQGTYLGDMIEYQIDTELAGLARRPAPERPRRRRTAGIRPGRAGDAHLERRGEPGPRDLTQTQRNRGPRGGDTVTERDLKDLLTQSNVSRRGFLAAAGLTGVSAFLAACSSGGSATTAPTAAPTAAASAAPPASASAAASAAPSASARRRRAVLRRRRPADHVQLVAVHLPGQHRQVQGRVRDQEVPVRHLRQQRRPDGQAPGRRDRLRHRIADDELPAGDDRVGLPPEARHVADPEHRADQPDVPQAVVGSDRGVRRPQGLRDDRHPLSHRRSSRQCPRRGRTSTT